MPGSVAFVGLGTMGQAMVRHLLSQGYQVSVWNRSPGPVDELVADGARRSADVSEAFAAGPVFSMLANDDAVSTVFSSDVLAAAGPDAVHVNMATVSVALAKELTQRHTATGVGYAAIPVLGRPPVAASGQLNLIAAGDPAVLRRPDIAAALDTMGKRTWKFGDEPWRGNVAKIIMNFLLVHMLSGLSEGIALAERNGLDTAELVELLNNSFFPGPVYKGYATEIADRNYLPAAFSTVLGRKDLKLAQDAAAAVDLDLPSVPALVQVFEAALAGGYADHDWAAIAEIVRGDTTN